MKEAAYKLLNIVLMESDFKRERNINFEDETFNSKLNIGVDIEKNDNRLFVTVFVNFSSGEGEIDQIEAKIRMTGIFQYSGDEVIPIDKFAKINAPAIIFPFIREHLSSLSLKAGLKPILLPPINFVKLSKEMKTKEEGK